MVPNRFRDRHAAGQALAEAVLAAASSVDLVLALPRGGVPVAAPVARRLGAGLDLIVVRKLGTPGNPELAMGAIASGGVVIRNEEVISAATVDEFAFAEVKAAEERELVRRLRAYRGDRPYPLLARRHVALVDDGIATGATLRAAIEVVRRQRPASVTVAVPVAPPRVVNDLATVVDRIVCLQTPPFFMAIGSWYEDFSQTTDDEVCRLLEAAWNDKDLSGG